MEDIKSIDELIDELVANLKVDYKDQSVLTTPSKELDRVNYFFSSICSNNNEVENLLYSIMGYAMCKTAVMQKGFVFLGKGRNGKSVVAKILEKILGPSQCSYESLEKLSGNKAGSKSTVRFLKDCTLNLSLDQVQPKYINHGIIKKIISGDTISEIHGKERIVFRPYATMIFIVNDVIDFKDSKICMTDRLMVVPFTNEFIDNRDINIEYDLCKDKSLQIIATKSINAFKEVLIKGKFTIPYVVEKETKRYFMDSNNVLEFCSLYPIKEIMPKETYHKKYCKWCESNNLEAYNNVMFGKEVINQGYVSETYRFDKVKKVTCYVSQTYNKENNKVLYNSYLESLGLPSDAIDRYTEDELVKGYGCQSFGDFLFERENGKCN